MWRKTALVAFGTLFLLLGMAYRVSAETLYKLDNMVLSGDFAGTSLYSWSNNSGTTTISNTNNELKDYQYSSTGSTSAGVYHGYDTIAGHIYYIRYFFKPYRSHSAKIYFRGSVIDTGVSCIENVWNTVSTIQTAINTASTVLILYDNGNSLLSQGEGVSSYYDNIIVIDLTVVFGAGFEPSKTDFETLYLPDMDYFDLYESYKPESYIDLTSTDYTNLSTDLTSMDYTKSVIDNYGENVTLDISILINNGDPTLAEAQAHYYLNSANETVWMQYLGISDALTWELSDYSHFVLDLIMTDAQEERLKRILFDRSISETDGYFRLRVIDAFETDGVELWVTIGSTFDLKVDISSVLVSQKMDTNNEFNIEQMMYFKAYDQRGNLLLPAIRTSFGDVLRTTYYDDFGSQFTDVGEFSLEFELNSPDDTDVPDDFWEDLYLYELGVFSSSNIIQPPVLDDSEIGYIFESQTCEWYELGCQAKNGINEISQDIYIALRIDEIVATIQDIIDSVGTIVAILPDDLSTILTIILSGVSVALIIIIIDRITGGGST